MKRVQNKVHWRQLTNGTDAVLHQRNAIRHSLCVRWSVITVLYWIMTQFHTLHDQSCSHNTVPCSWQNDNIFGTPVVPSAGSYNRVGIGKAPFIIWAWRSNTMIKIFLTC